VVWPLDANDGTGFGAVAPDLPGCLSDGETQAEAIANLQDAINC
jgi:predicted RNase H-like HicB family nuclease